MAKPLDECVSTEDFFAAGYTVAVPGGGVCQGREVSTLVGPDGKHVLVAMGIGAWGLPPEFFKHPYFDNPYFSEIDRQYYRNLARG